MTPPVDQMNGMSPFTTPSSMMSALSVGSHSEAIDCASWKTTTATMRGHAGRR